MFLNFPNLSELTVKTCSPNKQTDNIKYKQTRNKRIKRPPPTPKKQTQTKTT